MIDSHSHIYLKEFTADLNEVLERAHQVGITDICMPAIDLYSIDSMKSLEHPSIRFHKMVGVHPTEMKGGRCNLEASLLSLVARKDVVAVGETGLDYYWSKDFVDVQKQSLRLHFKVAKILQKPIVLHNRDSTSDLLTEIEAAQNGSLQGVWHCFTGSLEEGKRAIDSGFYLGIGGVLTFKNSGIQGAVAKLPLSRMLLETDAPYLAPTPHRGKRNEPSYVELVAKKLAEIKEISVEEVIETTSLNAKALFKI